MFHGWENFFIVGATAGGTLIGLLFVAITPGAGLSTPEGKNATDAFLTPTFISAACYSNVWPRCRHGRPLSFWGCLGWPASCTKFVIVKQRQAHIASLDWLDWIVFSAVPLLGDASLMAGAAGLVAEKPFAPYAIAGAITLLLSAGIYGAWSITLWIARNRDRT